MFYTTYFTYKERERERPGGRVQREREGETWRTRAKRERGRDLEDACKGLGACLARVMQVLTLLNHVILTPRVLLE